ncbi:MAG: carbohydrate ABC transporter permease [Chloroflexi bacterium]|nr:carbohydrate ABC transporter permease [Chloroflexota bacterium]
MAAYVLVVAVCLPFVLPLIWMLMGAGKTTQEFLADPWSLPTDFQWHNFAEAWVVGQIGQYTLNSLFVTTATLVGVASLGFPMAYAIARIRFTGHRLLLGVFAASLFIPMQIFVVSLFDLESQLGLIDTSWAMILPYIATNLPFTVLFLTAFLRAVPIEIEDAATLDGASRFAIMTRIMLPLSRPAFATVIVFTFLGVWNEFIIAYTVTHSDAVRTLPVGLLNFSQQFGQTDYPRLFAALSLSAIPIFVVFLIGQRQFMRGLTEGAVKL